MIDFAKNDDQARVSVARGEVMALKSHFSEWGDPRVLADKGATMNGLNEFLRYMRDVVVLLGGDGRIAELLNHPELITTQDVDDLRQYAVQLLEATKAKLVSVSTRTVTVGRG